MNNNRIWWYVFAISPYLSSRFGLYVMHNARVALLGYHALLLLYFIIQRKELLSKRSTPSKTEGGYIVLLSLLVAIGIVLGICYLGGYILLDSSVNILSSFGVYNIILFAIVFCSLHSIWEELFWTVSCPAQSHKEIVLHNTLFAGYHIVVLYLFIHAILLPLVFVGISIAGTIRSLHYHHHRNKTALLLSHIIIDIGIMAGVIALQS